MEQELEVVRKVVLSLSGGMDSTTLLAYLLDLHYEIVAVNFQYGSKHNKKEAQSIKEIAEHYKINVTSIDLSFINEHFESDLLKSGGDIPKGHYEAANMSKTVIPGRNLIMTSILAGYAESINAEKVVLGQHEGDHAIYADCRPEFVYSASETVKLSSGNKVSVAAPFILKNKNEICKMGLNLKVPYELTTTCYNGREKACGFCGCCVERIEAFMMAGVPDPIKYEVKIDWEQDVELFLSKAKEISKNG